MTDPTSDPRTWTDEEIDALREAFGGGLNRETMEEALLSPEEQAALHEHLAAMANQRRRVEAESRGVVLP